MELDSNGTTTGSLSSRELRLLNYPVRQLVRIVAGAGRADLRKKDPALRNRLTDSIGRLSRPNANEDAVDQSVPCTRRDSIVEAFIRQDVHAAFKN